MQEATGSADLRQRVACRRQFLRRWHASPRNPWNLCSRTHSRLNTPPVGRQHDIPSRAVSHRCPGTPSAPGTARGRSPRSTARARPAPRPASTGRPRPAGQRAHALADRSGSRAQATRVTPEVDLACRNRASQPRLRRLGRVGKLELQRQRTLRRCPGRIVSATRPRRRHRAAAARP